MIPSARTILAPSRGRKVKVVCAHCWRYLPRYPITRTCSEYVLLAGVLHPMVPSAHFLCAMIPAGWKPLIYDRHRGSIAGTISFLSILEMLLSGRHPSNVMNLHFGNNCKLIPISSLRLLDWLGRSCSGPNYISTVRRTPLLSIIIIVRWLMILQTSSWLRISTIS